MCVKYKGIQFKQLTLSVRDKLTNIKIKSFIKYGFFMINGITRTGVGLSKIRFGYVLFFFNNKLRHSNGGVYLVYRYTWICLHVSITRRDYCVPYFSFIFIITS